jgi:hypothetical protein
MKNTLALVLMVFGIVGFVQANEPVPVDSPVIELMEIDKKTGIHVYCVTGYVFISQGKELPMTQVRFEHPVKDTQHLRCETYLFSRKQALKDLKAKEGT